MIGLEHLDALEAHLDRWMADAGRPLHSTARETLMDGIREFITAEETDTILFSWDEWMNTPSRDSSNHPHRFSR